MTTALNPWRYLLRDGRCITAAVHLDQDHLFRYVTKDSTVVFALLSVAAERLLLQMIQKCDAMPPVDQLTSRVTSQRETSRKPSPITDLSLMHH